MNKQLALIALGGIVGAIVLFTLAGVVKPDLGTMFPGFLWNDSMPWTGNWSTAFDCDDDDRSTYTSTEMAWNATDSLAITLPGKVEFTPGNSAHVTVKGPANLINHVRIHDDRLEFDRKLRGVCGNAVTVSITAPAIKHWSVFGVGKLQLHQLDQADLDLKLFGTGIIQAEGTVGHVGVNITGTGRAALDHLQAGEADVAIIGVGRADVRASQRANIAITGPGRVTLHGQPKQLDSKVIGPGRITSAGGGSVNGKAMEKDDEDREDEDSGTST